MTRVPATRTLENALRRVGLRARGRRGRSGPRLPGRPGRRRRRGPASRPAHSRRLRLEAGARGRARATLRADPGRARSRGRSAAADPREIDRINIHQASLRAMQRAVLALAPLPDIVLVDAFRVPDLPMAQRGVRHGDRRCSAIAAASIVAKVTRDRQMLDAARPRPALRIRSPQGLRDGRSPRRRGAVRLFGRAPPVVPPLDAV